MSDLAAVFGRQACREYLLPDKKNCRYSILIEGSWFGFEKDIRMHLINQGGVWCPETEEGLSLEEEIPEREDSIQDIQGGRQERRGAGVTNGFLMHTSSGEKLEITFRKGPEGCLPLWKCPLTNELTVGRDENCQLFLPGNNKVSRRHLVFLYRGNEWIVRDLSKNGFYLNGRFSSLEHRLRFGDCVIILEHKIYFLGSMLAIDSPSLPVSTAYPDPESMAGGRVCREVLQNRLSGVGESDGSEHPDLSVGKWEDRIRIRRSPRNVEKIDEEPIGIDRPPDLEEAGKESLIMTAGPLISMSFPMLGGSLFMLYAMQAEHRKIELSAFSGLVMTGLTLVFTLAWAVAGAGIGERQRRKRIESKAESYRRYLSSKNEKIKNRYDMTRYILLSRYPAAEACAEYTAASAMLWERNSYHEDFLWHRLGTGEIAFPTRIDVPKEEYRGLDSELWSGMNAICKHYKRMQGLPILLHLDEHRQIGLLGENRTGLLDMIRTLAVQIAAGNSYSEVKMALFYDKERKNEADLLDFYRWLPHLWDQSRRRRYLAGSREEARELAYELSRIFKDRAEHGKGEHGETAGLRHNHIPHYILFILVPDYLEGEMLGHYIYEEPRQLGMTVLWCVDEREKLPNSCRLIVENTELFQGFYDVTGAYQEKVRVDFDQVDREKCAGFARRLTRMYVPEGLGSADLPSEVSFFSLFGVDKTEGLAIQDRWEQNRTAESMRAAIGFKIGGQVIYLDIHEKYHGPHGLIAGMTGSGKSEMLQTYILSMAVNYSPLEVNFFLIDYKGGGMAGLFSGLPHICGSISNLSGGLISRALTSIKSENLRRQKLFSRHGVNHIRSYARLFYEGKVDNPLPHLIIIIDEFAELKKEEPDFMKELISVAQVGRSLGVHLILATQKPAGTVSDNIWSNSRFRICLKVQDRQDSMDMIHRSDASRITQVGRGYLQVGNDEIFELFQSGWSGAPEENRQKDPVRIIANNGMDLQESAGKDRPWNKSNRRGIRKTRASTKPVTRQRSQLRAVVETICSMAEDGQRYPVRSLWMDPLPKQLFLEDLRQSAGLEELFLGLLDDPENQRRENLTLNLEECGHILLCGSTLSGKSVLLQTFLFSLMVSCQPESVHVYVLDFGGGALSCFCNMPHLGGIARPEEKEKQRRILEWLISELDRRKELLQGGNYRQYRDGKGRPLPVLVLLIDSFGDFQEKTERAFEKYVWRMLKEGENCGLLLFISGRDLSSAEVPSAMGSYFRTKICLSMKEVYSYMEVLGCISLPVTPETGIAGRGITFCGKRILEFQTALCLKENNDFSRKKMISERAQAAVQAGWTGLPEKIRCIPGNLSWDLYWNQVRADQKEQGVEEDGRVFLGYDDRTAELFWIDLADFYCLSLTGSAGGSLNIMKIFIENARENDKIHLILLDLGKQFCTCRHAGYCRAYAETEEEVLAVFEMLTGLFRERNTAGRQEEQDDYYLLCITGFQKLMEMACRGETGMDGFLENIWEKGRGKRIVFLGLIDNTQADTLELFRAYKLFTGDGRGFAAGGTLMDQRIFSIGSLSYEEQLKKMDKRECYVFSGEEDVKKIIIPEVDGL